MAVYLEIKIAFRHFSKRISKQAKRQKQTQNTSDQQSYCWCIFYFFPSQISKNILFPSIPTPRPLQSLKYMGSAATAAGWYIYFMYWFPFACEILSFKKENREITEAIERRKYIGQIRVTPAKPSIRLPPLLFVRDLRQTWINRLTKCNVRETSQLEIFFSPNFSRWFMKIFSRFSNSRRVFFSFFFFRFSFL